MIFKFKDKNSKIYFLSKPFKMTLLSDFDTPADSLYVVFVCDENLPEFCEVEIENENETIFNGIIDEQICHCSKEGIFLEISARSFAAVLLDNEAIPATYFMPSLQEIFEIHAKDYGIKDYIGQGRCNGNFTISKGTSEWEVIENFVKSVIGVTPHITSDLILNAGDISYSNCYKISNTLPDCESFISAKVKNKRYGTVSTVLTKLSNTDSYNSVSENEVAVKKGIKSRRLLNLANVPEWEKEFKINRIFEKSKLESFVITVKLPFQKNYRVGDKVEFYDDLLGNYEDLMIWSTKYTITDKEKTVILELRRS
ncbi:MAG: hypothetical protein K5917_00440 [Clostridiales bacterium]|nr:hypothetical protein [Clostridiales bacterium]